MKSLRKNVAVLFTLAFVTAGSTGCGSGGAKSMLKNLAVRTYELDGAQFLEVKTHMDSGKIGFSGDMPIFDPNKPGLTLGTLGVHPVLSGGTEIVVALNLEALAPNLTAGDLLPNNLKIPLGVPNGIPVFSFPVGGGGMNRVYLSFGENVAMVGAAIVVKEFYNLFGTKIPGAMNYFVPFDLGGGKRGTAGIFAAPHITQSGFAFFADIFSSIPIEGGFNPGCILIGCDVGIQPVALNGARTSVSALKAAPAATLQYQEQKMPAKSYNTMRSGLYNASNRRLQVKLQ